MLVVCFDQKEKQNILATNTDEIFNAVSSMKLIPKQELVFSYNNIYISPFKTFNLVDIGILPEDNINIKQIMLKDGYFNIYYYNFQIIFPIYKFFNVFDIKNFFSSILFTVPQNITITYSDKQLLDDQLIYDFDTDENNPFIINVSECYSLFYIFYGCFKLICLPSNSTFENLKDTISAYSQKGKYTINMNYNYGSKITNYFKCPQDEINLIELSKFQSDIQLFEFTESNNTQIQKYDIFIEIDNLSKTIKYSSFYIINIYFMSCILEREFRIDRTLFEFYDPNGVKLEKNSTVGPNKNNKLKATVKSILHVKLNDIEKDLNYFTKIEDIKKSFNFDRHNFSVVINNHFVKADENDYLLIHFLNDSKSRTNIKINHSKFPCHEIILKNQEDGKMIKSLIDNRWPLEKIFQKVLNKNIGSFKILSSNENLVVYQTEEHRNVEIIFINEENLNEECCIEVIGKDPSVIDLLFSFYKFRSKKFFVKKYDILEPLFNKKKLAFGDKLSDILYDKENKITIRGINNKKNKFKKIIVDDFYNNKRHIIDYSFMSTKDIINLICSKENYQNEMFKLYMNYIELSLNDYPTLYHQNDDLYLIFNNIPVIKYFLITNCSPLKIQLDLQYSQFQSVPQMIKMIFNLNNEQEIHFSYKTNDDPNVINLPENFDARSLPKNSIIQIDYKLNETNKISFINNSFFKRKEIELSNTNLPIKKLKREIQSKLVLNDYSLNLLHFSFYQTKLDENKKFTDYKINSSITINVDEAILVKIYIPEKTLYKYFSIREKIKNVKKLLKIQYNIEYDFDLNSKDGTVLSDDTNLCNNMDIYFCCNKIIIKGDGSLSGQQFEISDILLVSEAIKYIQRFVKEKDISIFTYNKDDYCYEKVDYTNKLSDFKDQLFVHKIISLINFYDKQLSIPKSEQISELNSIKWLKKNFLSKKLLIDPKFIFLVRNNLYINENKKMIDVLNDRKGFLSIEFHLYENISDIVKKQKAKLKKHIIKPKITYLDTDENQIKSNPSNNEKLLINPKITIDDKFNIKSETDQVEKPEATKKRPKLSAFKPKIVPIKQSTKSSDKQSIVTIKDTKLDISQNSEINDVPKSSDETSTLKDIKRIDDTKDEIDINSKNKDESQKIFKEHEEANPDEEEDIDKNEEEDEKDSFDFSHIPIIDLSEYKIIKQIGEGGFGVAYLIENINTKELYAAKVSKGQIKTKKEKKQFFMEIDSQIKANNPSVLKLIGINLRDFNNEKYPTIITEYMVNTSLKTNLDYEYRGMRPHDLTETKKYIILLGLALGMKYLFLQGIIHRDLKPDNILLDENFYPHICDFGLSVISDISYDMSIVKLDEVCGTLLYEAPEIFEGQAYTYKVDVYSFSFIAYEILTGAPLFTEINAYRIQYDIFNGKRPDLSLIKDKEICKFLEKCWSANPKVRPTFNEIVEEIMKERYKDYFNADEDEVEDFLDLFDEELKKYSGKADIAAIYKKKADSGDIRALFNYGMTLILMSDGDHDKVAEAVKYIKIAADEGFSEAIFRYGVFCVVGFGVPINNKEAIHYVKISANKRNFYAAYLYGIMLRDGSGIASDTKKAAKYLKIAADYGIKEACHEYASMLYNGNGILKDDEKAAEYYKKGADCGDIDSMFVYGRMLHLGIGISKNREEAGHYYEKAADNGHVRAQCLFGRMCIENNNPVAGNVYLIKAAEKGDVEAIYTLGYNFYNGIGTFVDKKRGFSYFMKAAALGDDHAMLNVGFILENGDGVKADPIGALKYYKMAIEKGNTGAMVNLALMFIDGNNYAEASKYMKMAADLGDEKGMTLYGKMLFYGNGIPENKKDGLLYVKMAVDKGYEKAQEIYNIMVHPELKQDRYKNVKMQADKGDIEAIFQYAQMLYTGNGVDVNYKESLRYFKMAADKGHIVSAYNYGYMLLKGIGASVDIPKAAEYLKIASDGKFPKALLTYATLLMNGDGIPRNNKDAAHYYQVLALLGYPDGMYAYGTMVLFGIGIPANEEEGLIFLNAASQMGVPDAHNKINEYFEKKEKEVERIKLIIQNADKNDMNAIFEIIKLLNEGKQINIDKSKLAKFLIMAINKDNPDAMFLYAEMLFNGNGVDINQKEAVKLYKKSAEKGNEKALFFYGKILFDGIETTENKVKAIEIFKKCADLNNDEATVLYASILYDGAVIPSNKKESFKYFKKSAENGNLQSMFICAQMLIDCDEIEEDKKEASKYFKICANNGNLEAAFLYAKMLLNGDGIAEDKKEALKYFKISADGGNAESMLQYANLTSNDSEKVKYYKMSIEKGNNEAILKYGDYLAIDRKLSKVNLEDIIYLKKAADLGHPEAMLKYGYILNHGIGIRPNQAEGAKYIKFAVDKDVQNSYLIYAGILLKGEGVPKNPKEACKYFELAIEKGDEMIAAFDYAEILYKGDGIEENKKLAAKYYKMAADKGNSEAMNKYGEMLKYGDGIEMDKEEGERYIQLAVDNEEQLRKNYQFVGNMLELLFPGAKNEMNEKYPGLFD